MAESNYKYDVAISLLGQDQGYAEQLEQAIRKNVRGDVFLYSRRQGEIAATGELVETFTRVFRDEARVVVVLYRTRWGQTSYTSIEQDAIKARRARTTSIRFMVLVSMEPPQTPEWFPGSSEFWLDPAIFSPEAIAAVVAERVHETGGTIGPETPLDRAKRLQAKESELTALQEVLQSGGIQRFIEESQTVFTLIELHAEQISSQTSGKATVIKQDRICTLTYRWATLVCQLEQVYSNSLDGAGLTVSIQNWNPLIGSRNRHPNPQTLFELQFTLTVAPGETWGWRSTRKSRELGDIEFLTTSELVDWLLGDLIERAHQDPPKLRPEWHF